MTDPVLADIAAGDALPRLVVDVTPTLVVMGSAATGDWARAHHDSRFAIAELGVSDVFLSTPTQSIWLERFITDWTGPRGRLGRLSIRMRRPVTAGSTMVFDGAVGGVVIDDTGCGWVDLSLSISITTSGVEPVVASSAQARVAVPVGASDNPWARRGAEWAP